MSNIEIYEPDTAANALEKALDAPRLDPVILAIANEVLAGKEICDIADEYNVSADLVTASLEKPQVKDYIDNVVMNQGFANRAKRVALINGVITKLVEDAMENGVYTKKDLLEWVKVLNQMEDNTKGRKAGPQVAVQVNNYSDLMRDLLDKSEK